MTSKFTGRDYATLRSEIIEFLRKKLPKDWDYNNLADPVVIFAESLARVGDQLHYTIDELRRECDVATAKRASSIYSYAMREGYKMFLPRASFGTISINTVPEQDGLLHLKLAQFDEIKVKPLGESLYVVNENISGKDYAINADLHGPLNKQYLEELSDYTNATSDEEITRKRNIYLSYIEDVHNKTQHVNVVLGKKNEFAFTYNDINNDSTVELPDPMIDRELVRLQYTNSSMTNRWETIMYVDDVISSGFEYKSFTLTPKFIGGAITLNIEFPTNYRDIFDRDLSTRFRFEYIKIKNSKVDPLPEYQDNAEAVDFGDAISIVSGHAEDNEIVENGMQYRVNFGEGVKGYAEYENANITRDNYKKFVQNYSALLTKDDYRNYIRATSSQHCEVYDHGDCYKIPPVLPEGTDLIPRVIYTITDAPYSGRENLWYDLRERSSRSDCLMMIPYGKDPYMIVIKAECYLVGTSIASVATAIENELIKYYGGSVGEKIPKISMINYLAHKASDAVVRMESLILRDSTVGTVDTTFNSVNQLDNDQVDTLYRALVNGDIYYESPLVDDSKEDEPDDYLFYLRGIKYEDDLGNVYTKSELDKVNEEQILPLEVKALVYNKYPPLTKEVYDSENISSTGDTIIESTSEFADFPDRFPKIYYVKDGSETEISSYDQLITHQVAYGELDTALWDVKDTNIYSFSDKTYGADIDVSTNYSTQWIEVKILKKSLEEIENNQFSDGLSGTQNATGVDTGSPDSFITCYILASDTDYDARTYVGEYPDDVEMPSTVLHIESDRVPIYTQPSICQSGGLNAYKRDKYLLTYTDSNGEIKPVYFVKRQNNILEEIDPLKDVNELKIYRVVDDPISGEQSYPIISKARPYDMARNISVDDYYIKHHYMVPVLNKVVVLIKAVNNKS